MNAGELAAKLNGCEYRQEIDRATEAEAKKNSLVVVFGASDDLMEFRGAIHDEVGAYEGVTVWIDSDGLIPEFEYVMGQRDKDGLRDYFLREGGGKEIEAIWDEEGYSWIYKTEITHFQFNVMEDGDKYCRGIVFSLADL